MPILADYYRSLSPGAQQGLMRTMANAMSQLFANKLNEELGLSIKSNIDAEMMMMKCRKIVKGGVNIVIDLCTASVNQDARLQNGTIWVFRDQVTKKNLGWLGRERNLTDHNLYVSITDIAPNHPVYPHHLLERALRLGVSAANYSMSMLLTYDMRPVNASMLTQQIIINSIPCTWVNQGSCKLSCEWHHTINDSLTVVKGDCPEPTTNCTYNPNQHIREFCPDESTTVADTVSDLYSTTVHRVTAAISGSVADAVATSTASYTDTAMSSDSIERSSTTISSVANDTFKWISERTTEAYDFNKDNDGSDRTTYQIIIALLSAVIFIGLLICGARSCAKLVSRNRWGRGAIHSDRTYAGFDMESQCLNEDEISVSTYLSSPDPVLHSTNASRVEESTMMATSSL